MKISIVTVCYNEEKNIERTLKSVLSQTFNDFEYIICDGKSKDNTVRIAESYTDAFREKGVSYQVCSEKDGGIYYGMNNGIDRANGEYIYFLNAGDWFYSNDVVEKVCNFITQNKKTDVIYGHIALVERNIVNVLIGNDEYLTQDMSIAHPATFVRTELMKKHKFNTKYRIVADYDFLISRKLEKATFKQIDSIIAYFSIGGVSTVDVRGTLREHFDVCERHGLKINKYKMYFKRYKSAIAYKVKSIMPQNLWNWWSIKIKHKQTL
jgi:glycosyltransferase involved in cell wall biosynthesis